MTATATASPAGESTTAVDPIDALDLSDSNEMEPEVQLPENLVLGGRSEPADEAEPAPVATNATEQPAAPPDRPALPEGYKYDAMGRVRDAKTGHVVSKEKAAEILAAASPPTAKPQPFQYRTKGETKPVDGFLENADGTITVAAEKSGELRALLNARDVLGEQSAFVDGIKAENAQLKQQIEQQGQGSTAAEARANALVDAYGKMLQEPDEAKAIEAFFRLRQDYPVLLAKAEANHFKTLAESGRPAGQPKAGPAAEREGATPHQQHHRLPPRESAIEETTDRIEHLKLDRQFRDLSADDWKQFSERTARTPYAYIRPATADDAQAFGVTEGEVVFDIDALAADVTHYASAQKVARETAASQAKLAADNARKTTPSITAPPVAGGGSAPAKGPRAFTNEHDIDRWLDSDEI